MKTLNLLAVGRSFAGMREKRARLRVEAGKLPRFGPVAPSPSTSQVAGAGDSAAGPCPTMSGAQRTGDRAGAPESALPVLAAEGAREPASPFRRSGGNRPPQGNWMRGLRRLLRRRGRKYGPLIQGELSLDTVQVVRNDLSDADVEVVTPARAVVGRMRRDGTGLKDPVVAVSRWRSWLGAWMRMSH
ncbi:MAG: hypothetical protein H7A45_03025 [Verrucomicrobiales bacterium]|nr:hypothetical protein [Verrucomicrobiales bacterium]